MPEQPDQPAEIVWIIDEYQEIFGKMTEYWRESTSRDREYSGVRDFIAGKPGSGKSSWLQEIILAGLRSGMDAEITDAKDAGLPEEPAWPPQLNAGDTVQIIDTVGHAKPVSGHVIDVTGMYLVVASALGKRDPFYRYSGWRAWDGDVRWRIGNYIPGGQNG